MALARGSQGHQVRAEVPGLVVQDRKLAFLLNLNWFARLCATPCHAGGNHLPGTARRLRGVLAVQAVRPGVCRPGRAGGRTCAGLPQPGETACLPSAPRHFNLLPNPHHAAHSPHAGTGRGCPGHRACCAADAGGQPAAVPLPGPAARGAAVSLAWDADGSNVRMAAVCLVLARDEEEAAMCRTVRAHVRARE